MTALRFRFVLTEDLEHEELEELTALCEVAYGEPFASIWERVGPGLHVMAQSDGHVVAHAMIVDRSLHVGADMDVTLDAGYVENVATLPEEQGRGHGTAVMGEVSRIIRDQYAVGALATGSNEFYARLGWKTWAGPTWVRMADGQRLRTATEDGHVMILRTPNTPQVLDVSGPIACDWRPDEPW